MDLRNRGNLVWTLVQELAYEGWSCRAVGLSSSVLDGI
jgi:hypothetical protein